MTPFVLLVLAISLVRTAPLKGLGSTSGSNCQDVDGFFTPQYPQYSSTWWYNWTPYPVCTTKSEFVPMIWGLNNVNDIEKVNQSGIGNLLTFNEPDNQGQSNMTPDQAVALWPRLEATGMRLGSPAVGASPNSYQWLDEFFCQMHRVPRGLCRDALVFVVQPGTGIL